MLPLLQHALSIHDSFLNFTIPKNFRNVHSRKLTWIPKMMVWKRWFLSNMAILVSMLDFWGVHQGKKPDGTVLNLFSLFRHGFLGSLCLTKSELGGVNFPYLESAGTLRLYGITVFPHYRPLPCLLLIPKLTPKDHYQHQWQMKMLTKQVRVVVIMLEWCHLNIHSFRHFGWAKKLQKKTCFFYKQLNQM